jgi:GNAT superfamily N-acetyltransferase
VAAGHDLTVRRVAAAEVRPLRLEVLRPGQPAESVVYPGDDDATTAHFGAFVDGQVVAIGSLYAEDRPGGDRPGWRLRGMATSPGRERQGLGAAVLAAAVAHVAANGGGELWCNARTPAAGFYRRAGFEVEGDEFDIPGIGPHSVMRRLVVVGSDVEGDGEG